MARLSQNRNSGPATVLDPAAPTLAEHAAEIRRLGKRVVGDVIEIGRHLTEVKDLVGHGNWLSWLKQELDWSKSTAENFINVFKLAGKFPMVGNLDFDMRSFYLLAAPLTPDEARIEVIERAEAGETVTVADVKQTISTTKGRQQPSHKSLAEKQWRSIKRAIKKIQALQVDPAAGNAVDPVVSAEARKTEAAAAEAASHALIPDTISAAAEWQSSLSNAAGDSIAMQAYWTREFPGWKAFDAPSVLLTLVDKAAWAWVDLARHLRSKQNPADRTKAAEPTTPPPSIQAAPPAELSDTGIPPFLRRTQAAGSTAPTEPTTKH